MKKLVPVLCSVTAIAILISLFQNCGGAPRRLTINRSTSSSVSQDISYTTHLLQSADYADIDVEPLENSALKIMIATNPSAIHGVNFLLIGYPDNLKIYDFDETGLCNLNSNDKFSLVRNGSTSAHVFLEYNKYFAIYDELTNALALVAYSMTTPPSVDKDGVHTDFFNFEVLRPLPTLSENEFLDRFCRVGGRGLWPASSSPGTLVPSGGPQPP